MNAVTVIIPVCDEVKFIRSCLDSVVKQIRFESLEVLVVDGNSTDGTRDIIQEYCTKYPRVRLLDNPSRIVPTAMNIGIREAKGDCIIRVDGHCILDQNYIHRCVEYLDKNEDLACVGGVLVNISTGVIGKAISLAMSSPFGVGDAYFRYSNREAFVDTVAFGAYRRRVFDEIGFFDEELVRNQDDEFNYRLRDSGGKILLVPEIKAAYYTRSSFKKLWLQYYRYGFWKIRVMQKHPKQMRPRQFVPPIFVSVLLFSVILSTFTLMGTPMGTSMGTSMGFWLLLLVGSVYALANISASIFITFGKDWKLMPLVPVAFAALHLSYGIGFLIGLARFSRRWGDRESRMISITAKEKNIQSI